MLWVLVCCGSDVGVLVCCGSDVGVLVYCGSHVGVLMYCGSHVGVLVYCGSCPVYCGLGPMLEYWCAVGCGSDDGLCWVSAVLQIEKNLAHV